MRLSEQLIKRKEELKKAAMVAEERIRKAPEGKLRISKSKNYVRFYNKTEKSNNNGKYISAKKFDLACLLAQKEYDNDVLKKISKELYCLDLYGCINRSYSPASRRKLTGRKPSLQDIMAERLFFIHPS